MIRILKWTGAIVAVLLLIVAIGLMTWEPFFATKGTPPEGNRAASPRQVHRWGDSGLYCRHGTLQRSLDWIFPPGGRRRRFARNHDLEVTTACRSSMS